MDQKPHRPPQALAALRNANMGTLIAYLVNDVEQAAGTSIDDVSERDAESLTCMCAPEFLFVYLDWLASELRIPVGSAVVRDSATGLHQIVASWSPTKASQLLKRFSKKQPQTWGERIASAYGYTTADAVEFDRASRFVTGALELASSATGNQGAVIVYRA